MDTQVRKKLKLEEAMDSQNKLLEAAITAIWKTRTEQELLLDLGERKNWSGSELSAAIAQCVEWWSQNGITADGAMAETFPSNDKTNTLALRDNAGWLSSKVKECIGVAKKNIALALLFGVNPKKFANSLSGGYQAARAEHLWMASLAGNSPPEESFLYHQRTEAGTTQGWQRLLANFNAGILDAWDALHIFTLLALHQRRRPTTEAKGSRNQLLPRKLTPKPIALLKGKILSDATCKRMLEACSRSKSDKARSVALLVVEWRLTEIHLMPHHPRSFKASSPNVQAYHFALDKMKNNLTNQSTIAVIPEEHRASFLYRIERMREYVTPRQNNITLNTPYFKVCSLLEEIRATKKQMGKPSEEQLQQCCNILSKDEPGVFMMKPQLYRILTQFRGNHVK